jgi:hypothetical protein
MLMPRTDVVRNKSLSYFRPRQLGRARWLGAELGQSRYQKYAVTILRSQMATQSADPASDQGGGKRRLFLPEGHTDYLFPWPGAVATRRHCEPRHVGQREVTIRSAIILPRHNCSSAVSRGIHSAIWTSRQIFYERVDQGARMVAIEFGMWRSGRNGGSPGSITVG